MIRITIIESPYAGNVERNLRYVRACMRDCFDRGEIPYASHALYTQPGVLDDDKSEEREKGIAAGLDMLSAVHQAAPVAVSLTHAFYTDLGWSSGMNRARNFTVLHLNHRIEERTLGGEWAEPERFYLLSTKHGFVGNAVQFWGPNECGYVCSLDEAGLYSKAHCDQIIAKGAEVAAVPESVARAASEPHVTKGLGEYIELARSRRVR